MRARIDDSGSSSRRWTCQGIPPGTSPTSGHGALFCGDTLFSAGCGRLFEGTAEQMLDSLDALSVLPDGTRVYLRP